MLKEKWGTKKGITVLLSCMIIMLLVFCTLFGYTFAWLSSFVEKPSVGTTKLATISGGLSSTENTYDITMPNAGSYVNISSQSTITNTGSLNALVRVFYSFTINEEAKQIATTTDISAIAISTDFVASDENIANVYSGYYYYNKLLAPGKSASFISTVTPTATIAGQVVKFNIFCELVNYEGGPYQLEQELPWNNTPASWFLNYEMLTKSQSSVISPKLNIGFRQISKIEITAKTSSTDRNLLFGRFDNAYIAANGSSWTFNNLVGGTYTMAPNKFCNGEFNTVTFTWTGCTASKDDYISLVWDTAWSKEITYKQIKIWNTAGELVYDLRPNPTGNGSFIDKVTDTALNMYSFNGESSTQDNTGYDYTTKVVYSEDFEGYTNGQASVLSCDNGASAVASTTEHKNGKVSAVVSNSLTANTVTSTTPARILLTQELKAGYSYYVSMWVKTSAPAGTMAYYKNTTLYARQPGFQIDSKFVNYTCSNTWTLVTIKTDKIQTTGNVDIAFYIPTDSGYTTCIDDIVISIAE